MDIEKDREYKEITTTNFKKMKTSQLSDDYELVRKFAKGAFGDIFLVYHIGTDSLRCLKIYNIEKMKNTN